MVTKMLMCYASTYGSTREVAEAIADELQKCGRAVESRPAREVRDLGAYDAVVLGAALYFGAVHKDAAEFLAQHAEALRQVPLALFALGPLHDAEAERRDGRAAVDALLAKLGGLQPVAVEVFGGRYDPDKLKLGHRLVAALPASPLHDQPAVDVRDWQLIQTWARSVAAALAPLTPSGGSK